MAGVRTPLDIALDLLARGIAPVPVPRTKGAKGPNIPKWQHLVVTPQNAAQYFDSGKAVNVGAIMGPRSGDLTDVDLDCPEAIALAPRFLPETGSVYGRASKQKSHYFYRCPDPPDNATKKFVDENGSVILELRLGGGGKGAQSVWPGSLHKTGEYYEWHVDGEPKRVAFADLDLAGKKIAVGTLLVRHWPAGGSRHDTALTVGGFLARIGWSPDAIARFVEAIATEAGDDDPADRGHAARDSAERHAAGGTVYGLPQMIVTFGDAVARQIAKIVGYHREPPEPTSPDNRPLIKVARGSLSINADEAEQALIAAGVPFFERSNALVRPIIKDVDGFHGTKTKAAQLARVNQAYMRDILGRIAHWRCLDQRAKTWLPIDPPRETAETVLARAGEWQFPSVAGIVTCPTLRPDGTILDQPGFDPETRLLLIDPPAMQPIPDAPTRDDAIEALELLKGLLTEFPFVGAVDTAVGLSTLVTPVARGAYTVAPMHTADAPDAGTGKSYLHDCAAMIATGQCMPVIAAGANEEESEKRLGSALLAGQPLVTIDNISGTLSGAALCQYIERPRPQVRVLGKSELILVETRGTTFFANGNNLVIVGDVCRRVVRGRLDAKMEDPELRVFKKNPLAMIAADRGAYIRACLAIPRAYIAAGRPDRASPLASFEEWSDTVRSALIWLGESDPVASMTAAKAEDPERAGFRDLISTWVNAFGTGESNKRTLKEVVAAARATAPGNGITPPPLINPDLNTALQAAVIGEKKYRQFDAASLGYWMRNHKDAIVGDYRFRYTKESNVGYWWVEAMTAAARAEPAM